MLHYILIAVCALLAGYFAYKAWATFDKRREDRRRLAILAAGEYSTYGLTWCPEMLQRYAVGDYSGIYTQIAARFGDWKTAPVDDIRKEMEGVFDRMLTMKLATVKGKEYVANRLNPPA